MMHEPDYHKQLAALLEQRRRDLANRPDVSMRMRTLSQSGTRFPISMRRVRRPALISMLIASAAILAMLILAITAAALVVSRVWIQGQVDGPSVVVENYFAALHQRDYAHAYSYFSTAARALVPEGVFADKSRSFDTVDGIVETYAIEKSVVSGNHATITASVVRQANDTTGQSTLITLTKESGVWRIDAVTLLEPASATSP